MRKEIKEVNVKDLLENINASTESDEIVKKGSRSVPKREYEYKFLFISGCDFALNRSSVKSNKTFVSILSQGLFFIYDEKKKTKTFITDSKMLKVFFSDKKADDFVIEPDKLIYAKSGIRKNQVENWFSIINSKKPVIQFLLKRGFFQLEMLFSDHYYYQSRIDKLISTFEETYDISPNLLNNIFELFIKKQVAVAYLANCIFKISDLDTTRYFINKLSESSMNYDEDLFYCGGFPNFGPYSLNVRTFTDYILFELYKQGKSNLSCLNTYQDYLYQSMQFYGKIKDKYPKSMETAHTIISQKVREKMRLKNESPKFAEIMESAEDFSYQNSLDEFKIIMPKDSNDLVEEGQYLCHCVASYVDKVNNGDCIVVLMREKDKEDTPYLTIEILPDRSISQIEGMNKREDLTETEIVFINRWAKHKHLKITVKNALMNTKKKCEKEIA